MCAVKKTAKHKTQWSVQLFEKALEIAQKQPTENRSNMIYIYYQIFQIYKSMNDIDMAMLFSRL